MSLYRRRFWIQRVCLVACCSGCYGFAFSEASSEIGSGSNPDVWSGRRSPTYAPEYPVRSDRRREASRRETRLLVSCLHRGRLSGAVGSANSHAIRVRSVPNIASSRGYECGGTDISAGSRRGDWDSCARMRTRRTSLSAKNGPHRIEIEELCGDGPVREQAIFFKELKAML